MAYQNLKGPASKDQIQTIEKMLDEHGLHCGAYERLWSHVNSHQTGETVMLKQAASDTIGWLGKVIDDGTAGFWLTHDKVQQMQKSVPQLEDEA